MDFDGILVGSRRGPEDCCEPYPAERSYGKVAALRSARDHNVLGSSLSFNTIAGVFSTQHAEAKNSFSVD